ncbi:MAG TPA: hypothetical protein PKE29_14990 [Phycisphaerales bacterium]|nr:hypothetical protein [Phycisphaerales bacterium]
MRSSLALAVGITTVSLLSGVAGASFVQIQSNSPGSTDGLGKYVGSITYTANTVTSGTLVISLTNTNTPVEGGYITGVVFNIPGIDATANSALASANPSGFLQLGPTASASPYGTYEAGAALGGSWLGGGSPNGGVGVGQTGTFTWTITAADAGSLTANSFLVGGSSPAPLVRFKGFANGGSDKVPGQLIPTPGAGVLAGLAGLVAMRRRRR